MSELSDIELPQDVLPIYGRGLQADVWGGGFNLPVKSKKLKPWYKRMKMRFINFITFPLDNTLRALASKLPSGYYEHEFYYYEYGDSPEARFINEVRELGKEDIERPMI